MLLETPLCWQNTEKVTPRVYRRSILRGNKGPVWSISVAAVYSERKFLTLKRCSILVKASPDRRIQKQAWTRFNWRL